ncbi:helix-turn-helix domain-containing protein [Pedobacter sp. UBA5917]|uniref:helix-turn-helix domain-containing protein n=1 Tax=Pedobacter sp. UBA5917 TaxID=1947061 RepID=UPI0025DF7CDA|nr:helix-turn-helix transcriptional regulator [Pedobacter sp. UBA5917]
METSSKPNRMHLGRKISRIRELRGMKQEALATELGISQQAISKLEQSEEIEDSTLEKVAKVLGVTKEAILQFSDDAVVNYFNTFNDNSFNNGAYNAFNCNFNPLDKLMEALEANKELYERLLASEREKVEILKNK